MNKEAKNEIKEDEIKSLVDDLKSLPSVKIPSDFDAKLRNKIALRNAKRENKFFSYSDYQRWLIYGFSGCIVLCIIILSITLINKQSSFNTDNPTFIYEGNKVTVIPPPTNDATSSIGNTGIGTTKNNSISPEKKEEYFAIQPDSNINRNLDSLNKIDSIKRKLDSQKVNIKK